MNNLDSSRLTAAAAQGIDDDAAGIAEALAAAWQHRLAALAPIVGQRGVAALYARSVALACTSHPWLGAAQTGMQTAVDLPALRAALTQRLLVSIAEPAPGASAHEESP